MAPEIRPPKWYPFQIGTPAAASNVGVQSSCDAMSLMMVFGLMTPGQRATHGTRNPPSQVVPFSDRNTGCREQCRCPVLVRCDVVDDGVRFDDAGPASHAWHPKSALPSGTLFRSEHRLPRAM